MFRSAILLLFCSLAFAQSPPGLEEKKGLVEGQVLNALTGEPVRRATVMLNRTDRSREGDVSYMAGPGARASASASTDANGRFSIPGVDPGTYMASVEKIGFLRGVQGAGARRGGMMLKVSSGQEIKGVQFKLVPQAVFTGRVVDEEGEPVQNVPVQVMRERYLRGRRQMMAMNSGNTNDKGEYRVANLPPGKYLLAITPNRMMGFNQPAGSAPEMGYAALYYPGVQDLAQATRLEAAAGTETGGLDFRMQKVRVYHIRGRVVDASGAPMRRVFVALSPRSVVGGRFIGGGSGSRQSDGAFEIGNVAPGSYILTAQTMEGGQATIQYPIDVGEANVDGIVLTPARAQTVEGAVVVEGGESINPQGTRIVLNPADSGPMSTHSDGVKADGTFSMSGVFPGRYQVSVFNTAEGTYVSSIKAGGQEVLGRDLEIPAGASPAIQVVLSAGAGQVNGTVANADGAGAAATVVLAPQDARRGQSSFYRTTTSDQTGAFSFRSVAPGDYKVFAWEEVETGAWEDPEFMRPLDSLGTSVRVAQRGTEAARVKVIPAGR